MTIGVDELRLDDEPDAVPRARRFATSVVEALGCPSLAPDAGLAVTELVTNALLHAHPPVVLRVLRAEDGIRVEVRDPARTAPVRIRASTDAMTGRGLTLVAALASSWGVTPSGDGKVVWCEFRDNGPKTGALDPASAGPAGGTHDDGSVPDIDALLAAWEDDDWDERYSVHLGDVPTDLLLAAKGHVDNLVREFTLAAGGAATGNAAAVPAHLARLIETVVHRFADARDAIKRQAVAASHRGDVRTSLTLTLPASAADAGEEYLAALDEADVYAHAARLLTLETPPQHSVFRRWYVESLVSQLRAAASGQPRPPVVTFEQRLLEELGELAAAQRASQWAARLQAVTASLAGARTVADVAAVVVSECLDVLGASSGRLLLGDDKRRAASLPGSSSDGPDGDVPPGEPLAVLRPEDRDAIRPDVVALRTAEPVWVESPAERDELFPDLRQLEPATCATCALPLRIAGRVLGALAFSFDRPRLFAEDERRFVLALAAQAAQALDRSLSYAAERDARSAAERSGAAARALAERLSRLQHVTAELVGVEDSDEVADIVATQAADALGADTAVLRLLNHEQTHLVGVRMNRVAPDDQQRWHTVPLEAELPTTVALHTGAPVVVQTRAELEARFPLLAGAMSREQSLVCAPLVVGARRMGVLALTFAEEHPVDDDEVAFVVSIANACAQALDRARAVRTTAALTDRLTFLADASAALSESLDYRATLTTVAQLVVPRLGDWCAVEVVEDGELQTVTVAHVDPGKVAFAEDLQRRYPPDPNRSVGVPEVIRTGQPQIVAEITDQMLVDSTVDAEHLRLARELQLSSALVVPLTGRSGTFGAISMFHAESGRRYDADDLAFAVDIARRAAHAVENAREHRTQIGRLSVIRRVAEAAQHAILAPAPGSVGPLRLGVGYLSAAQDALIGGDLYEVAEHRGAARLLIGDVRGKGLEAVRLATVVMGEFRAVAADYRSFADVARRMDERIVRYLGDEDFVTALLVEVRPDGRCELLCCGHPPPYLVHAGEVSLVGCDATVPLGLGAAPAPTSFRLSDGDRLLLYTDGLIEARGTDGLFADPEPLVATVGEGPVDKVVDRILLALRARVGGALADDLALIAAEYRAPDASR